MKKTFVMLCVVLASLAMAACGSSGSSTPDPGSLGGACVGGLCNNTLVCNATTNICEAAVADGDPDNNDTADGDTNTNACTGSCSALTDSAFCPTATSWCTCASGEWTKYTCSNYCSNTYGTASQGCDLAGGAYKCICGDSSSDTSDGDSTDNDTAVDGDQADGDNTSQPVGTYADPCAFAVSASASLNASSPDCTDGGSCTAFWTDNASLGEDCTAKSDCLSDWGSLGDCAGGHCGMSFCTASCTDNSDCTALGSGACCNTKASVCLPAEYCAPVGDQALLEVCTFAYSTTVTINADAGACVSGAICVGGYATTGTAATACTTDANCTAAWGDWGDCVNSFCGGSFCTLACDTSADCTDLGTGACCGTNKFCLPADSCTAVGDQGAKDPCEFKKSTTVTINAGSGACQDGLECVGGWANSGTGSTTCTADATCVTAGWDPGADCVNGYCGASFCTPPCDVNVDCTDSDMGTDSCCYTPAGSSSSFCLPGGGSCTAK